VPTPLEAIDRLIAFSEATRRDRALAKVEKWLAIRISRAFKAQRKAFLDALPAPRVQEAEGDQLPFPEWAAAWTSAQESTWNEFDKPLQEAIRISLVSGYETTLAELNIEGQFVLENTRAVEYARAHAAERVTQINQTTEKAIHRMVVQGTEQGLSYGEIARNISDRFSEFAVPWPQEHIQNRAHAVAVFETGDAFEAGNMELAQQLAASGLTMQKAWSTVGDDRVRPEHAANQDEGWIPIGDTFQSGNERAPTDPGCRCSILYRVAPAEGEA